MNSIAEEEIKSNRSRRTRIAIVANLRIYSELLRDALARRADCEVVGFFCNTDFAVSVQMLRPEILLYDLSGPDGFAMSQEIMRAIRVTNALAVGITEIDAAIVSWAKRDIATTSESCGSLDSLVSTLHRAINGERTDWPGTALTSASESSFVRTATDESEVRQTLTNREQQVLAHLGLGCSNKEIAKRLGIEVATVKNHIHNVLEKMRVHTRGEAVAQARYKT
jgi:two-component system nitrate/nitrite response regulator NarL